MIGETHRVTCEGSGRLQFCDGPATLAVLRYRGDLIGYLSRQCDRVEFFDVAADDDRQYAADMVRSLIREGAASELSVDKLWSRILALVPHVPPVSGRVDSLSYSAS